MAALAGGIVALVLGIIGIIIWWGYFLKALLAAVPAMLILGGALAAYLGFEELKDKRSTQDTFEPDSSLKDDVDSLKEEIKALKSEKEKLEEEKESDS
ncbi:MAG: hypothetical protein U5R49_22340 [Deltaproteobacteria bacterium]|nr:hypothetical protein [Deltaproteobacteria bacterium]